MEGTDILYKKKKFIKWFLRTFGLKRLDSARLLEFILQRDDLLQNINFVEDVRHLPDAVIISALDTPTVNFLCRINNIYYENIDDIIAALAYNPPERIFMWLSFDRESFCSMCDLIKQEDPEAKAKVFYHQVVKKLEKEMAEHISTKEENKKRLMEQIDDALDKSDKEGFMELSNLYKKLDEL